MKTVKTFFLNLFQYFLFWLFYPIVDLLLLLLLLIYIVSISIPLLLSVFTAFILYALSGLGIDYEPTPNMHDIGFSVIFYMFFLTFYTSILFSSFREDIKEIGFFKTNFGKAIIPLYFIARVVYIYINHGEFDLLNAYKYLDAQLIWGVMFLLMPLLIVIDLIAMFKKSNPKQVYKDEAI